MISAIVLLFLIAGLTAGTQVNRPRGVPLTKKVFYDPGKEFSCLDGSAVLPFHQVNDDYCDCADGSDEPGTAACPEGVFHCANIGHVPKNIQSSRVNDGICDCCDASDEFDGRMRGNAVCLNTCLSLGREAREARRQMIQLLRQGSDLRSHLISQAKTVTDADSARLTQVKGQLSEAEADKWEKEAVKQEAEKKEKAALEKYAAAETAAKQAIEEQEFAKREEENRKDAEQAFHDLDLDKDNILTFEELKHVPAFDQNGDGEVSDDEAKLLLHAKDSMDLTEWQDIGWSIAKPAYLKSRFGVPDRQPGDQYQPDIVTGSPHDVDDELDQLESNSDSEKKTQDINAQSEDHGHEPDDEYDESEDEADQYSTPDHGDGGETGIGSVSPIEPKTETSVEYDDETKALIEEANKAKDAFREAENKYNDLKREIEDLERKLSTDFGPENEFLPLVGKCFDVTDREYTYTLCPFDKATQRPKSGGTETSLGRWGEWSTASNGNKYSGMRYTGGTACWNGPSRSLTVSVICGLENQVTEAHEPNRCEYAIKFATPAACRLDHNSDLLADTENSANEHQSHEEL